MTGFFHGMVSAEDHAREEERKKKERARISVASHGGPDGNISLRGLQPSELENMQGMVENRFWCSVNDEGRLEKVNKLADVPGPVDDETMMPFWTPALPGQVQMDLELAALPDHWFSPGLQIQGLGAGMRFTPEGYAHQVKLMEEFGFFCMRSQRDAESGQYWELWNLPGLFMAKGKLREVVEAHRKEGEKSQVTHCVRFLCRHVRFGSLDVKWQMAALSYD